MSYWFKAGILGMVIGVVGLLVSLLPVGHDLEEMLGLDTLFKIRGTRPAPAEVVIVSIDSISATQLSLPTDLKKWPRALHARLIDALVQQGAAVIAFDVIFDEARVAEDDEALAEAIRRAGNVVLVESLHRDVLPSLDQQGLQRGTIHTESLRPPIPQLARAAIALAPFPLPKVPVKVSQFWTFKAGVDEMPTLPVVVFHIYALKAYDAFLHTVARVCPALAEQLPPNKAALLSTMTLPTFLRLLQNFFTNAPSEVEKLLTEIQRLQTSVLPVQATEWQLLTSWLHLYQRAPSRYLNFYGPVKSIQTMPYYQVLQRQPRAAEPNFPLDIRGKAVFVGSAEYARLDQKDGFYTVFSQPNGLDISGVEIAATAFANLVDDMPVQPLTRHVQLATIGLWGILVGVLCRLLSPGIAALSLTVLGAVYLSAAQYQFTHAGAWYPLIVPVGLQLPLAFCGAVVWKYVDTRREQQRMREAFGYYLPTTVIDQLVDNLASITTSSRITYGICLFTDAGEYSSLAETMSPEELGSFMNTYYEVVFKPVRQYGGMVSDVIGDAMLAIWSAAQPQAVLRQQACLAALEIARAVAQFKDKAGTAHLPTRIGLHAGRMLLGNVGALGHYEYRAVGDIVNTASRIEGLNKFLGTHILVSEEVLQHLHGFLTREVGVFRLAGKSQPLVVHELICRTAEATEQHKQLQAHFALALEAYRQQDWSQAMRQFAVLINRPRVQPDGPARFYMQLCQQYNNRPPGASWDGIVHMDRK